MSTKLVIPSALTRWPSYPELSAENLRDARLYATRSDLIAALPVPKGGKVAEIGVWRADFSKTLIDTLKPRQFFAFDIFTGHTYGNWHGLSGHQLFDGLTHRQFYEREMAPYLDFTTVVEGSSNETLRDFTDGSFDLVYVDALHDYDSVKIDAQFAVQMTAPSGYLVFNDYLLNDLHDTAYGVVPVVNELSVDHGWDVVGFAFNHGMYSDIALQRRPPKSEPASSETLAPTEEPEPTTNQSDVAAPGLMGRVRALAKLLAGH